MSSLGVVTALLASGSAATGFLAGRRFAAIATLLAVAIVVVSSALSYYLAIRAGVPAWERDDGWAAMPGLVAVPLVIGFSGAAVLPVRFAPYVCVGLGVGAVLVADIAALAFGCLLFTMCI